MDKFIFPLLLCAALAGFSSGNEIPAGSGQLANAPEFFPGGKTEDGREFQLLGQRADNGKLILTASNGFFDSGTCIAEGESELPKVGDQQLIAVNYRALTNWKGRGSLRWHFWLETPGVVEARVFLKAFPAAQGSELTFSLAGKSKTVIVTGDEQTPGAAPWKLRFEVAEAGEHTLEVRLGKLAPTANKGIGELETIALFGSAIDEDARLLRARWRPAAVHGGYECSKVPESRIWVMTTRSACDFSSYSPLTTPFGYYGTSFDADRRSNGSFNFSMWAASKDGKAPPLAQMPHLLATGSPEAEFSGFGHEGSGVKIRGWVPMPDRPLEVVQALRVENDGNYETYYGYFWNHPVHRWQLFAAGRKWNGNKTRSNLKPGSFCEVPGPPNRQRSGDQIREVRRRGWLVDEEGRWMAMDRFTGASSQLANKSWYITKEGEFAMATGGMRFYQNSTPTAPQVDAPLPEFLNPDATKQLFELPAQMGPSRLVKATATTATLQLTIPEPGPNARAILYYGPIDCLTFAKRTLHGTERNSEVSQTAQSDERTWALEQELPSVSKGSNQITLTNLQAGQTYFHRLLITNDDGQVWSLQSGTFQTPSE